MNYVNNNFVCPFEIQSYCGYFKINAYRLITIIRLLQQLILVLFFRTWRKTELESNFHIMSTHNFSTTQYTTI